MVEASCSNRSSSQGCNSSSRDDTIYCNPSLTISFSSGHRLWVGVSFVGWGVGVRAGRWVGSGGWVGPRRWRVAVRWRIALVLDYDRLVMHHIHGMCRLLLLPARVRTQAGHQATSAQRQATRVAAKLCVSAVERQT